MKTSELLAHMRVINAGCDLHPKYQAIKAPTAKCKTCAEMWAARNAIAAARKGS